VEGIGDIVTTVRTKTVATFVKLGYTLGVSWEKPITIAAGARLVPRNTPIAIAPIAIRLICVIIVRYCPMSHPTCGICHLVYIIQLYFARNSV